MEPNLATLYLFGMLNWIVMWFDAERNDPTELSESLVNLFLGGYRKATTPTTESPKISGIQEVAQRKRQKT